MPRLDVPILGFAPDLDVTTPGVVLEDSSIVPYVNGFGPPPVPQTSGAQPLDAACRGAVAVRKLDDSVRVIAGTRTKLYELSGATWTDVSKGGSYAGGGENRWRFTQFGNLTVACNKTDATQQSQSGAFADLGTNCPKAAVCETVAGFVMLLDYNDGTDDYADGWYCSPYQNPAGDWTASVATQAANGRLLDTPGPVRAGKRLGSAMVAYKERSTYMGFYEGPPLIWRWQLVPGELGAVSQEAVVDCVIDNVPVHLVVGYDDVFVFDGSRPVSISEGVRQWYNDRVPAVYRYRTKGMHDRVNGIAYFLVPDDDGTLSRALAFNYRRKRWGFVAGVDSGIEAVLEHMTPGVTYHGLGGLYGAYEDLPDDIAYDSPYWTAGTPVPAFFSETHRLRLYTGRPTTDEHTVYFGASGDDDRFRTVTRVRPRMLARPEAGSLSLEYGEVLDGLSVTAATYNAGKNKFDVQKSSKWFKPQMDFTGDWRMTGYTYAFEEDGDE